MIVCVMHCSVCTHIHVTIYHHHITHFSFLFIFELAEHLNTSLNDFEFRKNAFTLYGLGFRQYR